MPAPDTSRDEALKRLAERASAFEAKTSRSEVKHGEQRATDQAYRLIADLFGGVLVGLALGYGVDRLFDTAPAGLIGGVLLGFAASVWMAWNTAKRLQAQAARETAGRPPAAAVTEDEDED